MEKQNGHQLELFSESSEDNERLNARAQRSAFAQRIWGHEKAVLIALALLVTGIVCFSLGIEKGKRLTLKAPTEKSLNDKSLVVNSSVANLGPVKEIKLPAAIQDKELTTVTTVQRGLYTIQVASFKGKANAQKEADSLKKRGYQALFLSKGSYIIVCVGNFPNEETAQPLLGKLRKYYNDCRIRRL